MDSDITMSEGNQYPGYPAPESQPSTPYPALDRRNSISAQRSSSLPSGSFPVMMGSAAPAMADTARGYLSLSQYFELSRNQQIVTEASPELDDGGEAVDEGASAEEDEGEGEGEEDGELEDGEEDEEDEEDEDGEENDDGNDFEGNEDGEDVNAVATGPETDRNGLKDAQPPQPADVVPLPPPAQEDTWTSLPGVHHLPDEDFLETNTEDEWPHRMQGFNPPRSITATRGSARGRGSGGRSRGRRGWKWALKGTEHEGLFQSARITAEAAGTKRRGRGGRVRRGAPAGPRGTRSDRRPDPGPEFKAIQARATTAFLDNRLDEALQLALQAVTTNSEVPAAHFLIDQVLTAQGRDREALTAHWSAAVAARDADTWLAVGDRFLEIPGDDKTEDYNHAFNCFSAALKLDKTNYEARTKKVQLYIETKAYKNAFRECKMMLKLRPGDTDTLWQFAELLKLADDHKEARTSKQMRGPRVVDAYRAAFDAWRDEPVFGDANLQWAHLDKYIDLLEDVGTSAIECIRELKKYARWLLGRGQEKFWDSMLDDREFDIDYLRRVATEFWRFNHFNLDDEGRYGLGLPVWLRAKLGYLRATMGFMWREEAKKHFNVLLNEPSAAADNPETFMKTAERLSALSWFQDAIELYEAAKDSDHEDRHRFFAGMGKCYQRLSRFPDAEKALLAAVDADPDQLVARIELARLYANTGRKAEAADIARTISSMGRQGIQRSEKSMLASFMARERGRPRLKSLLPAPARSDPAVAPNGVAHGQQARGEAMDEDSSDEDTESTPASMQQKPSMYRKNGYKKSRLAHDEEMELLRDQSARIHSSYEMVQKLWPFVDADGDDTEEAARQWMGFAEAMASEFKNTKTFYPSQSSDRFVGLLTGKNPETRQVIAEMDSLRKQMRQVTVEDADENETAPTTDDRTSGDFHDISFQEWHRILADLALQYARFADEEKCDDMIDALTRGNVFRHDFALFNTTLAVSIYCAIVFNNRTRFLECARQYLYQSDYRSGMAYQVFAAAGSIGYDNDPFHRGDSKIQMWTQKLVKLQDVLIMDPEMREKFNFTHLDHGKQPRHERLGKVDDGLIPGLLTTYAHIVSTTRRARSSPSLAYLFRALALQPDEVVVNLSLAVNYIVDALQRVDQEGMNLDRQKSIQQALGFFYRYYNARVAIGRKCFIQEAEYNAARFWDLLGWTHLAAKGYEKVLKLSPQVREEAKQEGSEAEDLASEAAFALQKIFVAAENEDAARAIGEEWLVL